MLMYRYNWLCFLCRNVKLALLARACTIKYSVFWSIFENRFRSINRPHNTISPIDNLQRKNIQNIFKLERLAIKFVMVDFFRRSLFRWQRQMVQTWQNLNSYEILMKIKWNARKKEWEARAKKKRRRTQAMETKVDGVCGSFNLCWFNVEVLSSLFCYLQLSLSVYLSLSFGSQFKGPPPQNGIWRRILVIIEMGAIEIM